jgi:peptide/nickel transport system substrate-binding protein
MPPTDARWEWIKDAIATYEYDPRRSQQLLSDLGWRRGGDGAFVNTNGARVSIPLWTTQGGQNEQEQAIIADNWRNLGLGVEQRVLGRIESDDRVLRASFPAFETNALPISFRQWTSVLYGPNCPTEANRWAGRNRGCYQNPEHDRLVDEIGGAVDPAEQRRIYREIGRIQTTDLPVLPLYFNVEVTLFREGVLGIRGNTMPKTSLMWNVLEWDLR